MESSEFDQIIKNKLAEDSDAHAFEMEKSKPFVWAAIQEKRRSDKPILILYYMAAAVFLLLLCGSFFLNSIFQQHSNEVASLSQKIEQIEGSYHLQLGILQNKDAELDALCLELDKLEENIVELNQPQNVSVANQLVYVRDTIFIKELKYITQTLVPPKLDSLEEEAIKKLEEVSPLPDADEKEATIYPTYASSKAKNGQNETVKFRLTSFVSN